MLESAFYREFVSRHARVCDTMGACILREGEAFAFVSVLRALRKADYDRDDERVLRALVPHLRRAFEVQRRLASAELERAASLEILDSLDTAVFLLDEDRRILFENAAARRVLARCDALLGGDSMPRASLDPAGSGLGAARTDDRVAGRTGPAITLHQGRTREKRSHRGGAGRFSSSLMNLFC